MADLTKSKIFLWALVSFIAGVAVRSFVVMPYVSLGVVLCAAGAGIAVGFLRNRRNMILGGCFLLLFLSGIIRFDTVQRNTPDLSELYGRSFVVRGLAMRDPSFTDAAQRLKIKVESIGDRAAVAPFFVLVTTRAYPPYKIGDELEMRGVIERPENFSDFDHISYLARDNIFAVMPFPGIEKVGEGGSRLAIFLSRIKHGFESRIDEVLPEPHASLMKGLLLGERESLPAGVVEDFQIAGVSHIVALSGYNITLVGRFITGILFLFAVPFAASLWVAGAAIMLFVLLTGAASSVVRAGIMGILVLIAQKEGRMYHMTNALVFAGAAMIFHNPYVLRFDAGFQLSFLATVGLIYLSPLVGARLDRMNLKFAERFHNKRRIRPGSEESARLSIFKRTFVETLSAQIMVLPLLIVLFGRISLISPVANVLIVVTVPYAMAAGFAASVAAFVSETIGRIVGWGAWIILEYQFRAIAFFADFSFASIAVGAWAAVPLVLLYAVFFKHLLSSK